MKKGRALGFPQQVLRMAIGGYRMERRLVFERNVGQPAFARRGVVAGDSAATYLINVHDYKEIDEFNAYWRLQSLRF